MSRVEKIELFLKQEIARRLECPLEAVASDKNFIELGMNSMGVADLIIKTDKLLEANLSPSVLFKYPEVGTLSEYLAEAYSEVLDAIVATRTRPARDDIRDATPAPSNAGHKMPIPADILIPLQANGDKSPLFAVPGAGGSALSLQQLSHVLGNRQPFYCLEAVGLDGHAALMVSIEEIAAFNIKALKAVQGKGPYRVLGYSNGGVVAFEMARQLAEQDQEQVSLILLDSLCPLLPGKDPTEEMVEVFKHFVGSLGGVSDLNARKLQQVPEQERSEYLYNAVVSLGFELPKEKFIATFNAATTSEQACRAYQPARLPEAVDVTLFKATAGYPDAPEDYGWGQLLAQSLRTYVIKADHLSILDKKPLKEVAKKLNLLAGGGLKPETEARLEVRFA